MVTAPNGPRSRARAVTIRLILEALTLTVTVLNVLRAEARELLYMTATFGRARFSIGVNVRIMFRLVLFSGYRCMLKLP